MTDHFPWRTRNRAKLRRLETWDSKRRDKGWRERHEIARAKDRAEELKRTRKSPSLAQGLKDYRKKRRLSQEQLADELDISRRSLCNYESGSRPVPGDVLERIVLQGDIELCEIFAVPPEAPPIDRRFDDARLAISLLAACLEEYRAGPLDEILTEVVFKTGNWPPSLQRTENSVKRIAAKLMNELAERQLDAEDHEKMNDPDHVSLGLKGLSDKELADSRDLQFHFLQQSYATGNDEQFDAAVTRVAMARRMKSTGILEMISSRNE